MGISNVSLRSVSTFDNFYRKEHKGGTKNTKIKIE